MMGACVVYYRSKDGDVVDAIVWSYYGRQDGGVVERVLEANPGLADRGAILTAGIRIALPEIETPAQRQTVRLWG